MQAHEINEISFFELNDEKVSCWKSEKISSFNSFKCFITLRQKVWIDTFVSAGRWCEICADGHLKIIV